MPENSKQDDRAQSDGERDAEQPEPIALPALLICHLDNRSSGTQALREDVEIDGRHPASGNVSPAKNHGRGGKDQKRTDQAMKIRVVNERLPVHR